MPLSPCTATSCHEPWSHHQPDSQQEGPVHGGTWREKVIPSFPPILMTAHFFVISLSPSAISGCITPHAGRVRTCRGVRQWRDFSAKYLAWWFLAFCLAMKGSFLPGIVLLPNLGHVLFGIQIHSRNHPALWYLFSVIRSVRRGETVFSLTPSLFCSAVWWQIGWIQRANHKIAARRKGRKKPCKPRVTYTAVFYWLDVDTSLSQQSPRRAQTQTLLTAGTLCPTDFTPHSAPQAMLPQSTPSLGQKLLLLYHRTW